MKPISTGTSTFTARIVTPEIAAKPLDAGNAPPPKTFAFSPVQLTPIPAPATAVRADMTQSQRTRAAFQTIAANHARAATMAVDVSRKAFWSTAFEAETKDAMRELVAVISASGEDV